MNRSNLNIIATRATPGRAPIAAADGENPATMKEPVFVVFVPDEKVGQEVFKSLLEYMDRWSKDNGDSMHCSELLNAILVVKG